MKALWANLAKLKKNGYIGLNHRNLHLLYKYNSRNKYPLVDNKLETKRICALHGIRTPQTYCCISKHGDINKLFPLLRSLKSAVIKPAHGSGGEGVLLISHISETEFKAADGHLLTAEDIRYHCATILTGLYSLGGGNDYIIIEELLNIHHIFKSLINKGMPDIRIITFKTRPIMAMLRLPTALSEGKANLHQGGIGVGIDLNTGRTLTGLTPHGKTAVHPDTGQRIDNIQIPFWQQMNSIAVTFSALVELGFLGIDLIIDAVNGPVLLEGNARPGLTIQMVNNQGILQAIKAYADDI